MPNKSDHLMDHGKLPERSASKEMSSINADDVKVNFSSKKDENSQDSNLNDQNNEEPKNIISLVKKGKEDNLFSLF